MIGRSTNARYTHFLGDLVSNVESSHGVQLSGGSTGGYVNAFGDDTDISLSVLPKGVGTLTLGNSSTPTVFGASAVKVGSGSTTSLSLFQQYLVQWTVPALSSAGSAESTVTVAGLTTNSHLLWTPRQKLNSSVTGVFVTVRCSTADELVIENHNHSLSTLSGSTQSGYLLQIKFN